MYRTDNMIYAIIRVHQLIGAYASQVSSVEMQTKCLLRLNDAVHLSDLLQTYMPSCTLRSKLGKVISAFAFGSVSFRIMSLNKANSCIGYPSYI
jgi:hypothetical protein